MSLKVRVCEKVSLGCVGTHDCMSMGVGVFIHTVVPEVCAPVGRPALRLGVLVPTK